MSSTAAPWPRLRTGIDLVDVPRLRGLLARHATFAERIFTAGERAACERHPDPAPHYAARFAAKEATCKALGLGLSNLGIDRLLREIEVIRHGRRPALRLHGRAARRAAGLGLVHHDVSLTHEPTLAAASVVLLLEPEAA